jgi:hypothetical protein
MSLKLARHSEIGWATLASVRNMSGAPGQAVVGRSRSLLTQKARIPRADPDKIPWLRIGGNR